MTIDWLQDIRRRLTMLRPLARMPMPRRKATIRLHRVDALERRVLLAAPNPLALSGLNGTTGFRLDGIDTYDVSGHSVSSAGDVNGDGFDDLIIGARGADPGGDSSAGESYVVFGKSGGFASAVDLSTLDGKSGGRRDRHPDRRRR